MAIEAGGTSHRLNDGGAMMRSFDSKPGIESPSRPILASTSARIPNHSQRSRENSLSRLRALLLVALGALVLARAASAANVDGANVHWTSTGNGSQAVIFVHGWTCD